MEYGTRNITLLTKLTTPENLYIEHTGPITWNKRAFQRLVLPKRTKDLVQALVMVRRGKSNTRENLRLAGNRNDIITGKGNGLILLLHGGPGTGKTLTAGMHTIHLYSYKANAMCRVSC